MHIHEEAARCMFCTDAPCSKACKNGDPARAIRAVRFGNENFARRWVAKCSDAELEAAEKALKNDESAQADYYRAIVAARKGKLKDAKKLLDQACEKDPSLREKALKDIEFVAL